MSKEIKKVKATLNDDTTFTVKEVEVMLVMRDLIEIYDLDVVDALDGARMVNLIRKDMFIDFIDYQSVVDFVVEHYDLLITMKDEKLLDYARNNFKNDNI